VALPAGPLLGGALITSVGWRSVFLVNVPVVALAFPVAQRIVQESRERSVRTFDLPGLTLGVLFLAVLAFSFIEGGHLGMADPLALGALLLAAVLVMVFVWLERRRPAPMLPLTLFSRPAFSLANGAAATMNLVTLGLLFVVTLYLQAIQHRSPLEAGAALVPLFAPLSVIAPFAGRITARTGPRLPAVGGFVVSAAGIGLLLTLTIRAPYATLLPALLLWGSGLGLLTPAVVAAAMGSVPSPRAGLASAINNTARQAGGAIGIAALGALAGAPAEPASFMAGLHAAALVGLSLYVAAALASAVAMPSSVDGPR
jgi:DHA2 family methylenomycin A resistance protein-like MFS transporter